MKEGAEEAMDCMECKEILSAQTDGEARNEESERALEHVAECATCRRYQEEILSLRPALGAWPDEIPPDHPEAREGPARRGSWPVARWLAVAALVILAGGGGFAVGRSAATRPANRETAGGFAQRGTTVFPARNEIYSEGVLNAANPSAARLK
jgi:predicted anti-sigma-YlaC factor YlaD